MMFDTVMQSTQDVVEAGIAGRTRGALERKRINGEISTMSGDSIHVQTVMSEPDRVDKIGRTLPAASWINVVIASPRHVRERLMTHLSTWKAAGLLVRSFVTSKQRFSRYCS